MVTRLAERNTDMVGVKCRRPCYLGQCSVHASAMNRPQARLRAEKAHRAETERELVQLKERLAAITEKVARLQGQR